ncbi:Na+/H+ antiporter NhaC family protein [Dethiothermospora halolimnae]|uniref:Na+/H+ antiporter NhaC family protein n=1 Tax=Dethiothermospora halolimnae TaxID=3114390 RepID=UPI003CCC01EA
MNKKIILVLVLLMFISSTGIAVAADGVEETAERFGILTILPPLIAILLAFITKNVIISLFIGIFTGAILLSLGNSNILIIIVDSFLLIIDKLIGSLSDPWNAGIILQCLAIGGVITLITKMGGAKAITEKLSKRAKGPRSAQIITWLLGLLVFFDDYANSLIVGPIMRPVTDKLKISRERLAFIVDGTAAPIAGLALISTWIGYEVSLIKEGYDIIGQDVNAYNIFIETIPFRFYNILMLIFIVVTSLTLREFGPMLRAQRRAQKTGEVLSKKASPMASSEMTEVEPKEGIKLNIWNAIIPVSVLIFGALIGFYYNGYNAILNGDNSRLIELLKNNPYSFEALRVTFGVADASIVLFQSALLAGIVSIIMGVVQKIFTLQEAIDYWMQGVKSLIITAVILLLAWSLSSVITELGTADYLVSILSETIPKFILPSIIFILASVISFSTGTSFGTMGILMPLAIPLAYAISPENGYVIVVASGVLTGAIFGDHCSPISDTTILSSMGTACDHIEHTKTQMYYAITVGIITILFGYIPAGFGLSIYLVLPISIVALITTIFILGKKVDVRI